MMFPVFAKEDENYSISLSPSSRDSHAFRAGHDGKMELAACIFFLQGCLVLEVLVTAPIRD
jgi:hypothetical protein